MKRKLTFIGAGVVLILAAIIVIAGRGGLSNEKRRMNDEMVLTPEGKLVIKPGERAKMSVVVNNDAGNKSTSNPAPSR